MKDYSKTSPEEIWKLIRSGEIDYPTAGMCAGYAQANLVILPKKYAEDFKEFARKNPKPCPILEVVEGTPDVHDMGEGSNIVTDIPRYFIYRDGVRTEEVTDASSYWEDDFTGFLIGCSFSFEEALMRAGIEVRHIAMGCNVPMYKTNIQCESAGVFEGPMVVSMRPMTPENAKRAKEITDRYPNVHGGPVQIAIRRPSALRTSTGRTTATPWRSARERSRCSGPAALRPRRLWSGRNFRSSSPTRRGICLSRM